MKKIFFYSALTFAVASCTQTKTNYVAKVQLLKLTENDIFNKDLVYDVIFDSEELKIDSLKTKSRQLFLKGVDLFKNKNKPEDAITLFKQSILVFPDAKTYYELGNALLASKQVTTDFKSSNASLALDAYKVAEHLDFQPASTILYKQACATNLLLKTGEYSESSVVYRLEEAIDKGFFDFNLLATDPNIKSIFETDEYKKMQERIALKKVDNPVTLFEMYLKSYPTNFSEIFEITYDEVGISNYKQSISYDYAKYVPEMQNTSFGREVSHDFFFVSKVLETENYVAVVYSSVNFYGEAMQPVTTKIVTYTKEGNIIASVPFAGQYSAEKIKTGKIEKNKISLADYNRIWKHPITEVSFEENEVEKYELISKSNFVIDDSGNIKEDAVSSNTSINKSTKVIAKK